MGMRVVSTFPFFNELDLLEIHLETVGHIVDHFVITEARFSHAGREKPLYLTENLPRFKRYKSQLTVQVVDAFPSNVVNFEADWYQREQAKHILETMLEEGDYLIYGDVDEIPRPESLALAIEILEKQRHLDVAHFAQDLFYYAVNLREVSGTLLSYMGEYDDVKGHQRKWLGTTLNRWSSICDQTLTSLRNPDRKQNGVRIDNGGWHFSWVGSADSSPVIDRVRMKLENTAHQEFKSSLNLLLLESRIRRRKDIVGRRSAKFKLESSTDYLPDFLQRNLERFRHLFLEHDRD